MNCLRRVRENWPGEFLERVKQWRSETVWIVVPGHAGVNRIEGLSFDRAPLIAAGSA